MRLLLDTQAFIYWCLADPRLPKRAEDAIGDPASTVLLSAASVWEIRIKTAKGKLKLSFDDVAAEARRHRFDLMSITPAHAQAAGDLPRHHEDPFDRMLIAQARLEAGTVVTGDAAFPAYAVPVLWDK